MDSSDGIKKVKHQFIRFELSNAFGNIAQAEAKLDELVKEGWYIITAQFINDGNAFVALLEWMEIEDTDSEDPKPWES